MLSELYFSFSLIGLNEIKQKIGESPISNTDLHGYQFLSQPSLSNAGGVAFYINNNLNFSILDLNLQPLLMVLKLYALKCIIFVIQIYYMESFIGIQMVT